jgi:hypothetical protein
MVCKVRDNVSGVIPIRAARLRLRIGSSGLAHVLLSTIFSRKFASLCAALRDLRSSTCRTATRNWPAIALLSCIAKGALCAASSRTRSASIRSIRLKPSVRAEIV